MYKLFFIAIFFLLNTLEKKLLCINTTNSKQKHTLDLLSVFTDVELNLQVSEPNHLNR